MEKPSVSRDMEAIPLYEPGKPPRALWDVDYLSELERVWGRRWGAMSDIGKIHMIMVSRPDGRELQPNIVGIEEKDKEFFGLGEEIPDLERLQQQFDRFVAILQEEGIEVVDLNLPAQVKGAYLPFPQGIRGVRDLVILNGGAIIPRLGVAPKRGCEIYWARRLLELGCPILYTVHGTGCFEGGNVCWIDSKHVLVGISVRTNPEGLRQVEPIFKMAGVEEVHPVFLSSYLGESLGYQHHLDVVFGMVDRNLAVVFPPGIDWVTLEYLRRRGVKLIEVPHEEMLNAACNCLAVEPGRVIIPAGNPRTAEALAKEGVTVIEVDLSQRISSRIRSGRGAGGGGGPVCATAPLIREPV
ncbi:MAG: hypothetical protein HYU86_04865 [Chloroflexi bacterium]|nr:hypothetical protein [Chloroflexota bacterium]